MVIAKAVAGFLNTEGGALLIGVDDSGTVLGLVNDFSTVRGSDADRFELWLRDFLATTLGQNAAATPVIDFTPVTVDGAGTFICRVTCPASPRPVFVRSAEGQYEPGTLGADRQFDTTAEGRRGRRLRDAPLAVGDRADGGPPSCGRRYGVPARNSRCSGALRPLVCGKAAHDHRPGTGNSAQHLSWPPNGDHHRVGPQMVITTVSVPKWRSGRVHSGRAGSDCQAWGRRHALRGHRRPPRADPVRRAGRAGHRRPGRGSCVRYRRGRRSRPATTTTTTRPACAMVWRCRRSWTTPRGSRTPGPPTTVSIATRPAPRILADLAARGDLEGEQPHEMVIGRCQRSDDVVEPRLKTQWFVRTGPLAGRRARRDPLGSHADPPGAVREGLGALADRHPRLERLAPAVVGASDPGLVLPGRPRDGQRGASTGRRPARPAAVPAARLTQDPGHLRHLVQLRAVAVLHARLARRDGRPAPASTRAPSWRPATTSSSSGSPG